MNILSPTVLRWCRLGACILPLSLSACVAPDSAAEGQPFELDQVSAERAELTTRVKAALVADERVTAASIQVVLDRDDGQQQSEEGAAGKVEGSTDDGAEVLRLEGFVNDEAERTAALEIAREASQGITVIDALQVR